MKRLFSILLVLFLFVSCFPLNTLAVDDNDPIPDDPEYTRTDAIGAGILISSGTAYCSCFVSPTYSTDSVVLHMQLQKKEGSNWILVASWSTSGSGDLAINKDRQVASGYTYRVWASSVCYDDDGHYESATVTSLEWSY